MEAMTAQVLLTELTSARESLDRAVACLNPSKTVKSPRIIDSSLVKSSTQNSPIKFVTENGFVIERLCEMEESTIDSARQCHFVVHSAAADRCVVNVVFDEPTIRLIRRTLQSTLSSLDSAFWLQRAERQLAAYLWENNAFPANGHLTICRISDQDLQLALRLGKKLRGWT